MELKEELLRRIVDRGLWTSDTKVYLQELQNIYRERSSKHSTSEDCLDLGPEEMLEFRKFVKYFKTKFRALHRPRNIDNFMKIHSSFMKTPLLVSYVNSQMTPTKASVGRPKLPFKDLSDRQKRKRTALILEENESQAIICAAKTSMHKEGSRTSADIMGELCSSPGRPKKIKKLLEATPITPYTDDEALAYILDTRQTKNQYMMTRSGANKRGANLYPSYHNILEAKKRCYPDGIVVNDFKAEVPLQNLLNHTGTRLIQVQKCVLDKEIQGPKSLELLSKWGYDSATGQHIYNQKTNMNVDDVDENSLFVTNLIPLRLYYKGDESRIIWKNPVPNSTRYCRQIRFQYKKETVETSILEKDNIESEISSLQPLQLDLPSGRIEVTFKLLFTMIDGKIQSAVTGTTSAATCPVCRATPKEMNNIQILKNKVVNKESILMGCTPLHMYIRCFEMLLHISIRKVLPKPEWQIKGAVNQSIAKERKAELKKRFKTEWGMTILTPNRSSSGNTHTGNLARKFFLNPIKAASLLDLDEMLVRRLSVILFTINCGFSINSEKYRKHCEETFDLYVELYC